MTETTEEISEEVVEQERKTTLQMLQEGLNFYGKLSIKYKNLIDGAKTKTKKQYYTKKLKANNKVFGNLLVLHDATKEDEEEDASNTAQSETD